MKNKKQERLASIFTNALATILLAILVGVVFLNPLWKIYSPPFPMERVFPAITAPVDGPFYLQNATRGYQWETNAILSIWFHPLLSILIRLLSRFFSPNLSFWIISIGFGFGCILFLQKVNEIYGFEISPRLFPLVLVIPGGLSLATGNPEIPTLFFTSGLLISVVVWQKWSVTFLFALLAVLTKPNALYMVPFLAVYLIVGLVNKDKKIVTQSFSGILGVLAGWLLWIIVVDFQTGHYGSYWEARKLAGTYVAGNPVNFLIQLVSSFVYTGDIRDQIRYSTAVAIPLANIWLINRLEFSKEVHRYALTAGILTMMFIAIMNGNPNKIIVYTVTLPGYFSTYLMLVCSVKNKEWLHDPVNKYIIVPVFVIYCLFMLFVYVWGTPLGWYY